MSADFPTSIPNLTNPAGSNKQNSPSHATQHANANDNIEGLATKLGTGASVAADGKLLRGTGEGTSAWDKDAPEGEIVGDTDAQTLTNKTIDGDDNTISNVPQASVTGAPTGDFVGTTDAQELSNKTLLSATIKGNVSGWIEANETFTYNAAGIALASGGDIKYSPAYRLKLDQSVPITAYWPLEDKDEDIIPATTADVGTPTYTAGKFGNALTLDGSTDALAVTDAAAFKPTGPFSVGFWVKTTNAGTQAVFQSKSKNTNYAGFFCLVNAGKVLFQSGNNASALWSSVDGATSVNDGNWHYVICAYQSNFGRVYVDGVLDASGYMMSPTYAATNYVRIGCMNEAGSNSYWFNGQIDDLFLINGYAVDAAWVAAKYAAATAQGVAATPVTSYFIVTKTAAQLLSIFGGNQYTLINAAITNPYYSQMKSPQGFDCRPELWTLEQELTTENSVTNSVPGSWYTLGNSLTVPMGCWHLSYRGSFIGLGSGSGEQNIYSTLSTANNTESDVSFSVSNYANAAVHIGIVPYALNTVTLTASTTYYINLKSGTSASLRRWLTPQIIRAVCAYL